jgi:hypothetical protein
MSLATDAASRKRKLPRDAVVGGSGIDGSSQRGVNEVTGARDRNEPDGRPSHTSPSGTCRDRDAMQPVCHRSGRRLAWSQRQAWP